jgi:hypothetical protein
MIDTEFQGISTDRTTRSQPDGIETHLVQSNTDANQRIQSETNDMGATVYG